MAVYIIHSFFDTAFMCSTGYMGLLERKNSFTELCLAAPVIPHPMAGGRPVYFSDVIIRLENKKVLLHVGMFGVNTCWIL